MPLSIPRKAEAVVVVSTFVSHNLFYGAQDVAKNRGIPFVSIPHGWSEAKPLLLQSGLGHEPKSATQAPVPAIPQPLPPPPQKTESTSTLLKEVLALKKRLDENETLLLDKDEQLDSLSEKVSRLEQALRQLEQRFTEAPKPPPDVLAPSPDAVPVPTPPSQALCSILFTP
jgi:hypothetical protein